MKSSIKKISLESITSKSFIDRKKIAVVSSDVEFSAHLSDLIAMLGFKAKAVFSVHEALSLFEVDHISVALIDFDLNESSGSDLLDKCRRADHHFPVIFTSPTPDLIQRDRIALRDCCATLMIKPIDPIILREALEAACGHDQHHANCVHAPHNPTT